MAKNKKVRIPWKAIAQNLLDFTELFEDEAFGDYPDGRRGRLREEAGLTEEQLDAIGV